MKSIATWMLIAACGFVSGCAHRLPLISHAHVGHCLTTWHDTPQERGLFQVALAELDTAQSESTAALASDRSVVQKAVHLDNAAHALNPDVQPLGPGLDYGAIRALESAIEHLEYAATSGDASQNIVSSVAGLSEVGLAIAERLRTAATQAKSAGANDPAALERAAVALNSTLQAAIAGVDANGDGRIEPNAAEAGMQQLRGQLDAMLARESDPAYQPVERKYLLGLVRLPDGKWIYQSLRKMLGKPDYGY